MKTVKQGRIYNHGGIQEHPQRLEVQKGLCTCSHGSFAGQSQQAFLLQDETGSDEGARAHRQGEADVKVYAIHIHGRKQLKNC